MRGFSETQTKELIKLCDSKKSQGDGLLSAFKEFANKYDRAMGSVRNYYYKTIKQSGSEKLRKKLGITPKLMPAFIKEFNKAEERDLLLGVLTGISQGKSCRAVFMEMSQGNQKLALRYQNKYRNLLKDNRAFVEEMVEVVKCKNGYCKNPYYKEKSDERLKELENKVDELLKSVYFSLQTENQSLKTAIELLKQENKNLKKLYKQSPIKNYFISSDDTLSTISK